MIFGIFRVFVADMIQVKAHCRKKGIKPVGNVATLFQEIIAIEL